MKRGNVLVTVNGFLGEEDFYLLHKSAIEIMEPEDAGYSVDSMCIGGYLKKDGILLRASSECPYDTCCFFYDASSLSEGQLTKVENWISAIAVKMNETKEN
jgi:hypothetical protein